MNKTAKFAAAFSQLFASKVQSGLTRDRTNKLWLELEADTAKAGAL